MQSSTAEWLLAASSADAVQQVDVVQLADVALVAESYSTVACEHDYEALLHESVAYSAAVVDAVLIAVAQLLLQLLADADAKLLFKPQV